MNLDAWLERISNLHPRKWDLGLDRVASVGRTLEVLKPARKVFLVAGTNGKGSACEALEALCLDAGLTVGKSTSPHLVRFNERIVINGRPVADDLICAAFEKIDRARGETSLSYFEFSALAALLIFAEHELDVAVLEIGLGGRLDAMNIVDPDVSIITHIAMDHESWLGSDLESIAREKAGVMRAGQVCVIADDVPPASLAEQARSIGAILKSNGTDFGVSAGRVYLDQAACRVDLGALPDQLQLPLPSLLAALQAFESAFGSIQPASLALFNGRGFAGRYQQIAGAPRTIVDVAHNPDAAARLASMLAAENPAACRAVFAMYDDKDIDGVVRLVSPFIDAWYLTRVDEDRAAKPQRLADVVSGFGGWVAGTYDKVSLAYEDALADSKSDDLILVFGSFPLVGEVMRHLDVPVYP